MVHLSTSWTFVDVQDPGGLMVMIECQYIQITYQCCGCSGVVYNIVFQTLRTGTNLDLSDIRIEE